MLDEGLAILEGLWSGEPFSYDGTYYKLAESTFRPTPVQEPRVPIWVGGMWPNRRPFRRAARYEGAFPIFLDARDQPIPATPDLVRGVAAYIDEAASESADRDLAITGMGYSVEVGFAFDLAALADAGVTWWLEQFVPGVGDPDAWMARVLAGPPAA